MAPTVAEGDRIELLHNGMLPTEVAKALRQRPFACQAADAFSKDEEVKADPASQINERSSRDRIRERLSQAVNKLKKLGKGCDGLPREQCVFLLPDHWLEVFDPEHRCHLKPYFRHWLSSDTHESFYDWLDTGAGRELDLEERPRRMLMRQRVRYCSGEERDFLEVDVDDRGLLRYKVGQVLLETGPMEFVEAECDSPAPGPYGIDQDEAEELDTLRRQDSGAQSQWVLRHGDKERSILASPDRSTDLSASDAKPKAPRWIYIIDMQGRMYVNRKNPGKFHHSSFTGGEPVRAAGSLAAEGGRITTITAWSGHYRPDINSFSYALDYLSQRGVNVTGVRQYYSKSEVKGMKKSKKATPEPQ